MYKFIGAALTVLSVSLPVYAGDIQNFVDNASYFTCAYLRGGASVEDASRWGYDQAFAKMRKADENSYQAFLRVLENPDHKDTIATAVTAKTRSNCGNVVQLKR